MFDFAGRGALITGAGSGIGRATVRYFLECGANVLAADINAAALEELAGELPTFAGSLKTVRYDAVDPQSADAAVADFRSHFDSLDYVVAAAGIYERRVMPDVTDDDWRRMIGVNLDGVFFITRSAMPHMKKGGAFVLLSSVAGHTGGTVGNVHYGASKGGVLALTRGLARELAPDLRVNCVSPGWTSTPMNAAILAERGDEIRKSIPLQRTGEPSEIASVVAFLCSDASSFMTGEALLVTGGAFIG